MAPLLPRLSRRAHRRRPRVEGRRRATAPGIFFTHHKCASTWLGHILEGCCGAWERSLFRTHLSGLAPPPDRPFDLLLFTNSEYDFCARSCRPWLDAGPRAALHVIRNPLDVVVSAYYSHLATHPLDGWPQLARQRAILRSLDKASGMLATWAFLECSDFYDGAVGPLFALRRWDFNDPRIKTLRMEDLVGDHELARSELRPLLGADPADVLSRLTFEKLSGGRPKGVADNQHHYRSGKPHQWLDEMDASLARAVYHAHQALIDAYYPEAGALLRAKHD